MALPAFNEEELLPACLEALAAQEYEGELEILVVDNASTDDTARVARSHGARVVVEPRRGYCNALVRGFAAARGEIIACDVRDQDSVDRRERLADSSRFGPKGCVSRGRRGCRAGRGGGVHLWR